MQIVRILISYGATIDVAMPTVSRRDVMTAQEAAFGMRSNDPLENQFGYANQNMEIGNGATPIHAAFCECVYVCLRE